MKTLQDVPNACRQTMILFIVIFIIQSVPVAIKLNPTRNSGDSLRIELALPSGPADDAVFSMAAGNVEHYFIHTLEKR